MSEPIDDGYPVIVRLTGRAVLIVGGGTIALRKAEPLAAAGARVTVVSPDVVDGFADLADVTIERRRYRADEVQGYWLVVAATNDPAVQQQVFDDGERHHVWVNAVDDPDRCAFILPAIHRRGPVIVAVSTQGRSPALAGRLRDIAAAALPPDVESLAEELATERRRIQAGGESTEDLDWSDRLPPA